MIKALERRVKWREKSARRKSPFRLVVASLIRKLIWQPEINCCVCETQNWAGEIWDETFWLILSLAVETRTLDLSHS